MVTRGSPPPERLARALALAEPYRTRSGVLGAYLGGSSTRPYVDPLADLDLFILFEDEAHAALPERDRYVLTITADLPRRKDVEIMCLPWGALESYAASRRDPLHFNYHFAHILFAADERLATMFQALAGLNEATRLERLRVHYYELIWTMEKAAKCRKRSHVANARLVEAAALDAVRKLLFVACSLWPSKLDWASQELLAAGVPADLVAQWEACAIDATPALEPLRRAIDAWLTARGDDFHHNTFSLTNWCQFSAEGRAAAERWATVF
jgi:hypothetical protein